MANTASYRAQVRSAIVAALASANTLAGANVSGPRALPTAPKLLPMIVCASPPRERSENLMRGTQEFETTALFPVTARVAGDDLAQADEDLETLITQIKEALFASASFLALIERVAFVETTTALLSEGKYQVAEATLVFACEYPDFFDPAPGVPIKEFQATLEDQTTGETLGTFDLMP